LKDTIVLGDFNSNTIWDQRDRWWNHSDVVNILSSFNLVSLYHLINQEEQGNESLKTFYLYRKKEKGYHIDYVFIPEVYLNQVTNFEVGTYEKWIELSDHTPLIFSII
jgi:exonuclease III